MTTSDSLWSGFIGFFRLFSIMALMPETEFSRKALADMLGLWSEKWDFSKSSRAQKMQAVVAFYDDHASSMGQGTWVQTFRSDTTFLFEHL